jgi:tetratricopeptide (TPR) repeat protein
MARLSRSAAVLSLRRLSREETAELITRLLPGADAALEDRLHRATLGNPLFITETARALAAGHALPEEEEGRLPVAQGVALVVRDRLSSLSSEARALAQLGSVLGREARLELLTAASNDDALAVRARAREIAQIGLWAELSMDRWTFTHALVRGALYDELSPERRAELEQSVALALHARVTQGESELTVARAHHALQAWPRGDASEVASWVLAAASHARARRAFEEAVTLLERACRTLDVDDASRSELLLALGWAYGDLGRGDALEKTFDEAIRIARRLQNPTHFARAVLGRGSLYVLGAIRDELLPLIDEALAGLPADEVNLRARLLARKASALTPSSEPSVPLGFARTALELVEGSNDARAILEVAVAAGSALGDFAPPLERAEVNLGLVRRARELKDRVLELRGLSRLVTDYLESGDVARADAVLLERDALASSLGHPRFRWMTPLFRSMRAMFEGRFEVCERSIEEARELIDQAADRAGHRCLAIHRMMFFLMRDQLEEAQKCEVEVYRYLGGLPGFPGLIRALVLARSGRAGEAREELLRTGGSQLRIPRSINMLAYVGETAALIGAKDFAAIVHGLLPIHADSNAVVGLFGLICGVPIQAVLGQLTHVLGRPDEARAHFERALQRTQAMGAPVHEAWVRYWYGLLVGNDELSKAAALARKLGVEGLAARAEKAMEEGLTSRVVPVGVAAPAPPSKEATDFTLRPFEGGWRIEHEGQTLVLKDMKGLGMLAKLLEKAGEELHALELVSGASAEHMADAGDAGELLDETARLQYRRRIDQLRERVEESEELGHFERAEEARSELEALSRELSRAVGLGGRTRRAGSSAERARVTAQRRLKEAIRRIGELDEALGSHLERTVRTGTFCAYEPNRRARAR